MASDDYEIYKLLQQDRIQEGAARREAGKEHFAAAHQLAAQAGLVLAQHTDVHYGLQSPSGWLLNVYPGNRRLYHDRQRPKPPFLKLKPDWNLLDVVRAAIIASNNTEQFSKEIDWKLSGLIEKHQVSTNEQIATRAYYLWEAAGCPQCDGRQFWHQAEKEMRG